MKPAAITGTTKVHPDGQTLAAGNTRNFINPFIKPNEKLLPTGDFRDRSDMLSKPVSTNDEGLLMDRDGAT